MEKRLGRIRCVTITTLSLVSCERAYCDYLGYRVVVKEPLSVELAHSWGANKLAGQPTIVLEPASGHPTWIRFVEVLTLKEYPPFKTYGWNAAEIIVQDVKVLAENLRDSPFKIVGEPANLSFTDNICAMQVIGPAGELLYFTQVTGPVPGLDLPQASTFVDYVFIVILGGSSLSELKQFYTQELGVPESETMDVRISMLSNAFNLPRDTLHPLSGLELKSQTFIEADQLPDAAMHREQLPSELPAGIALVSFEIEDIEMAQPLLTNLSSPSVCARPYLSKKSAYFVGIAGEGVELIEE